MRLFQQRLGVKKETQVTPKNVNNVKMDLFWILIISANHAPVAVKNVH